MKTKNRILVVVLVAGVLLFSQLTHVSLLRAESVYRNEEGAFLAHSSRGLGGGSSKRCRQFN